MNSPAGTLDSILADPLAPAREHPGGIGYVGWDFPQDVAFALQAPALHLPWRADAPTPFADQWLESSFPGWARSMLEDWSTGALDSLERVVFSRGDDASQRLYYYVRELQRRGRLRGPEALILDVARIPRESSRRHTRAALAAVAGALGLDDDALRQGIARANALRAAVAAIAASRAGRGVAAHRLARASLFADVTSLVQPAAAAAAVKPRVLLVGSAPPDERLHEAAARAGGDVVGETHGYSFGRLGPPLDAGDDPLSAIAARLHEHAGPRSFADPTLTVSSAIDVAHPDVVVLWLTREDEALAWQVPALRGVVSTRQLPLLELTARHWDASDGALGEIEAFVRSRA
jgi:hypothetical protein